MSDSAFDTDELVLGGILLPEAIVHLRDNRRGHPSLGGLEKELVYICEAIRACGFRRRAGRRGVGALSVGRTLLLGYTRRGPQNPRVLVKGRTHAIGLLYLFSTRSPCRGGEAEVCKRAPDRGRFGVFNAGHRVDFAVALPL